MKLTLLFVSIFMFHIYGYTQFQNFKHFNNTDNQLNQTTVIKQLDKAESLHYASKKTYKRLDSMLDLVDDSGNGQFQMGYKSLYEYDNNGNLTKSTDLEANALGSFDISYKEELSYDNQNRLTERIQYGYSSNQYIPYSKITISYTTNLLFQNTYYTWSASSNTFEKSQMDMVFLNGDLIIDSIYGHQWDGSYFYVTNKIVYYYTGALLNETKGYVLNGYNWEKDDKTTYTYNATGLVLSETNWVWFTTTQTYGESSKIEYTYNTANQLLTKTSSSHMGATWNYEFKTDFDYDTQGNAYKVIHSVWNSSTNLWENETKLEGTFDNSYSRSDLILPFENYPDVEIYFNHLNSHMDIYYGDGANWSLEEKYDIYYSDFIINSIEPISKEKISIAPNPTTDFFFINRMSNDNLRIEIYDISGKLVKNLIINQSNKVDINELNNGLYFVRITDSKNVSSTRKIIKHAEN